MKKIIILLIITITLFSCGNESKREKQLPDEVWVLEWNSRSGGYSTDLNREYVLFFSENDAEIKAQELKDAWAIVKNTSDEDTNIKIYKQK